eukprot:10827652-Alexandrium_andersonii.AAC.1
MATGGCACMFIQACAHACRNASQAPTVLHNNTLGPIRGRPGREGVIRRHGCFSNPTLECDTA